MTRLFVLAFAVCAVWQGMAKDASSAGSPPEASVVAVGKIPTATVRPGDTTTVVIPVVIADGYHVQANPASDEFLIPLELELHLEEPESLVTWKPVYPAPGTFRLEGTTEDLLTYGGSIAVEVLIHAPSQAPSGERLFSGTLSYQACDTKRCLFPSSVPVTFKVVIRERTADG